jgi:hypothetical protein
LSAQEDLLKLLFPTQIVEYFDLIKVEEVDGTLNFHLEELNLAPSGYLQEQLESKGFLPEIRVQDFPIRGKKVYLHILRRRWRVISSGETISRDWGLVAKGSRMTQEFGLFLKKIFGPQSSK